MTRPNQLARTLARFEALPTALRVRVVSLILGRIVPLVGTAGLRFEEVSARRVVVGIRNRRPVQNHIQGVHAAGMALLAETATGFSVGMHLPDDKLPLIKTMQIDYLRRAQGNLRAEAHLSAEQIARMHQQDKGEVTVAVRVTDAAGETPIEARMVWAWVPKTRR